MRHEKSNQKKQNQQNRQKLSKRFMSMMMRNGRKIPLCEFSDFHKKLHGRLFINKAKQNKTMMIDFVVRAIPRMYYGTIYSSCST